MTQVPPPAPGFFRSFALLGDNLLAGVQDRLTLLSIELQEEKFRLVQLLFWISAVVFAGGMTLVCATLAVVYLFWESARLAVLGGLALFYGVALTTLLIAFRAYLRRQPRPFAATLEELGADRKCMPNAS